MFSHGSGQCRKAFQHPLRPSRKIRQGDKTRSGGAGGRAGHEHGAQLVSSGSSFFHRKDVQLPTPPTEKKIASAKGLGQNGFTDGPCPLESEAIAEAVVAMPFLLYGVRSNGPEWVVFGAARAGLGLGQLKLVYGKPLRVLKVAFGMW